jgi:hypothetical protein
MDIIYNSVPATLNVELKGNETITQLARRHFKDKSHTTTDEELRNAKIELSDIVSVSAGNLYELKNITVNNSL